MSKITVTTIAGQTSGSDANLVKIESGDTLQALSNATVGGTLGVTGASTLTGNVGIGNARTEGTLHIHTGSAGTVSASTQADDLVVENSVETGITIISPDDQSARIRFTSPSTNTDVGGATIFYRQNINKMNVGTAVAGGVLDLLSGAGVSAINADANGRVTMPGQPNFLARPNANDTVAAGGSKIAHDEAIHNIGNHYDTSNQRFTAPVAGIYYLEHIIVMTGGNAGILEAKIYVNGAERSRSYHRYDGNQDSDRTSRFIQLSAGDYAEPYCHWSSSNLNTLNAGSTAMMITSFSGYLMQ